jgi:hypothetical protein
VGLPVVMASAAPVAVAEAPYFIMPPSLGFYVSFGGPADICYIDNAYFMYRDSRWYRADYYDGPWHTVEYRYLPSQLHRHRYSEIRAAWNAEYRNYHGRLDGYRGHHFRPETRSYDGNRGNDGRVTTRRNDSRNNGAGWGRSWADSGRDGRDNGAHRWYDSRHSDRD